MIAERYLGVREKDNRHPAVDSMNRFCGVPAGSPWCASFVSWCLNKSGYTKFRTAWAGGFKTSQSKSARKVLLGYYKINEGDIIMWNKGNNRLGHVGFAWGSWKRGSGKTIEGNTSGNDKGSQSEGDGCFIKSRKIDPYAWFRIGWITEVKH